jgi:hypothetical protein
MSGLTKAARIVKDLTKLWLDEMRRYAQMSDLVGAFGIYRPFRMTPQLARKRAATRVFNAALLAHRL